MANGVGLLSLSPFEGDNHIGKANIKTVASNSLAFTVVSSFARLPQCERRVSHGGLYQWIAQTLIKGFQTNETVTGFANKLVAIADHAQILRRLDVVDRVGDFLLELPLPRQLERVGHFYQALRHNRRGQGDTTRSKALFERVADTAPPRFCARAVLALGTNSIAIGDLGAAMWFYREALQILSINQVFDPMTYYSAIRMTALVRSMKGDHRGALADLEKNLNMARIASSVHPFACYDYSNALAVELTQVGRLEEARSASRIALASPFAHAYPEWRETSEDIELKGRRASRSVVAFHHAVADAASIETPLVPGKLMRLPLREHTERVEAGSQRRNEPGRVLSLEEWKSKMAKESNGDPEGTKPRRPKTTKQKQARLTELRNLDTYQMLQRLLRVIGDEGVTDDELRRALVILEGLEMDEE